MQYGHCICLKWDESFHPIHVKQATSDLQQKETGSKTVGMATKFLQNSIQLNSDLDRNFDVTVT